MKSGSREDPCFGGHKLRCRRTDAISFTRHRKKQNKIFYCYLVVFRKRFLVIVNAFVEEFFFLSLLFFLLRAALFSWLNCLSQHKLI